MNKCLLIVILVLSSVLLSKTHDFELYDLNDKLVSTKRMRQKADTKLVAVDFFSMYCEPCKKALPEWEEFYKEQRKKGFSFVLVILPADGDRDAERARIGEYFSRNHVSFPVVYDKYSVVGKQYGVVDKNGAALVPQVYLISKDGDVMVHSNDHRPVMAFVKNGGAKQKIVPAVPQNNDSAQKETDSSLDVNKHVDKSSSVADEAAMQSARTAGGTHIKTEGGK